MHKHLPGIRHLLGRTNRGVTECYALVGDPAVSRITKARDTENFLSQFGAGLYLSATCPWAERCAPVNSKSPDRNAQNIKLTDNEKGPYTSAKFSRGKARM